jgi:hypothetical protein
VRIGDAPHDGVDRRGVGEVAGMRAHARARRLERLGAPRHLGGVAVDEDEAVAAVGEGAGDGLADLSLAPDAGEDGEHGGRVRGG